MWNAIELYTESDYNSGEFKWFTVNTIRHYYTPWQYPTFTSLLIPIP